MKPFNFYYAGHSFSGFFEFEPAEPATDIEPAIPAIATIIELYLGVNPFECYEHINPATIQVLEQLIIKDME